MEQVQEFVKEQSPALKKQIDRANLVMEHPLTKVGTTLMNDSEFTGSLSRIVGGHSATQFLTYEAVLVVAIWVVRAWRLSKSNTLIARLWTQAWIGAVFWVFAAGVVPYLVWGDAFRTATSHLIRVALRQFLA